MKSLRKNGGFTLVELIVVIAILAILAGVAVPAYSGYIKKAEDAAAITELDAIKTAAQATYATEGSITKLVITTNTDGKVSSIAVTTSATSSNTHTISYSSAKWNVADFDTYMNSTAPTLKGNYKGGASWSAGTWSTETE